MSLGHLEIMNAFDGERIISMHDDGGRKHKNNEISLPPFLGHSVVPKITISSSLEAIFNLKVILYTWIIIQEYKCVFFLLFLSRFMFLLHLLAFS